MAPSGNDWENNAGWAAQAIINNNERELLRRIWLEADVKPTAFVSVDTEYTSQGVCELGLATRQKHGPTAARHLIVNGTRGLRRKDPKPFHFGSSEEVQHEADLRPLLVDTLACLQAENEVVVLTGHDVQVELRNLKKCCGWEVPDRIVVLDTLRIWRSWINVPERGSLEQALEFFALLKKRAHLHNAGNDAGYTLELLVHKAIQAVECPVRMDKTDLEVRLGKNDRDKPLTPDFGKKATKKRKLEAQRTQGSVRRTQSPAGPLDHERVKLRKRRKTNDGSNSTSPAGAPKGSASGITDTIDLTGDTPPPQGPAQPSHMFIDLTDDNPPSP
ncbi:hypothetical protein BR93DRAFT_968101 [Coniochaeta sp. PMI_546]|nr:hypothetical protein BR93DRAFT_968101 [Coniochaeta sp. PMI_546]